MGRKVINMYGRTDDPDVMTLEVVSRGIYVVEIVFSTSMYGNMRTRSWCFEQSKGLLFTMDLSLELPTMMGYKTAKVYLRDFIMYHAGFWCANGPTHKWKRALDNYILNTRDLLPIADKRRQNKT